MGVIMNKVNVTSRRTTIKIKNINSGELINFSTRIESARFVGRYYGRVVCEMKQLQATVFSIDGEEYVFVFNDEERPIKSRSPSCIVCAPISWQLIEAVSKSEERTPLYSYLSAGRFFGLLIGHIREEEKREGKGMLARIFIVDGEEYVIEFGGRRRERNGCKGVYCCWRGIYDRVWWAGEEDKEGWRGFVPEF